MLNTNCESPRGRIDTRLVTRMVSMIFVVMSGLGLAVSARGQAANVSPERGFHAGGSYALSEIETISRASGELSLNIPLASLPPGRGGLSANLRLFYSSKPWDSVEETGDDGHGNPLDVSRLSSADSEESNWHYGFEYRLKLKARKLPLFEGPCDSAAGYIYQLVLVTPDGGQHVMRLQDDLYSAHTDNGYMNILPDGQLVCSGPNPVTSNITYYSADGTYLRLDLEHDQDNNWENNPWTLSMPDGTRVLGGTVPNSTAEQRIIDRNGNSIDIFMSTYGSHLARKIQDQLGRAIIIEYVPDLSQDKIHLTGANGQDLVWTVQWRDDWARKQYCLTETCQAPVYFLNVHQKFTVVDKIFLPAQAGSLNYSFTYNGNATDTTGLSAGWGEMSSITLPSGASAAYSYQQDSASGNTIHAFHVLRNRSTQKTLSYNAVYDGVTTPVTEQWSYQTYYTNNGLTADDVVRRTQTTGPDGGISNEYPSRASNAAIITPTETGETDNPDGSVIERVYASNPPGSLTDLGDANRFVKYEFTSVTNQAGTQLTKTAIKEYSYDLNGNGLTVKEYDWVDYSTVPRDSNNQPTGLPTNPAPTLVRATVKDYYNSALDFTSVNIYSKPGSPLLRNAVYSSEVRNGSATPTTFSRSEYTYDSATTTGNLTQVKSWDSTKGVYSTPLTSSNSISVTNAYDAYGNVTLTTDPRGNQTQLTYGSVGGFSNLYPTQIIQALSTAVARTTNKEYDFNTGLETRVTDADNNVATAMSYDDFGRATLVKAAEGASGIESRTATAYDDVGRRVVVRKDLSATGDGKLVAIQHYDQLGRVRLSRQLEDSADDPTGTDETKGIKVQTRYRYDLSTASSYTLSSNPYRAGTSGAATSEQTMGWSRTKSDNVGRLVEVQTYSGTSLPYPWGTSTSTSGMVVTAYDANQVTVTDQAGKKRRSVTDGLGRLIRVDEPDSNGNLDTGTPPQPVQPTAYAYDALDDLAKVTQGAQIRYFMYDSLKRLIRARNPEQDTNTNLSLSDPLTGNSLWSVKYVYDENSNLTTRTDARGTLGVTTTYAYDALNRVISRTYTNDPQSTPPVNYYYDNQSLPAAKPPSFTPAYSKGRLIAVTYGGVTSSAGSYQSYDQLGRVTSSYQQTDSINYGFGYGYNLASEMTSETYPSGRQVITEYDSAGRAAGIRAALVYYAGATASDATNRIQYAAHGAASVMKLGNGKWEHTLFNSRLQPYEIGLGANSSTSDLLKLEYKYGVLVNNVLDITQNNGNIQSQIITAPKTSSGNLVLTQTYTYDTLNRLQSASENGTPSWVQNYLYDRYGNRAVNPNSTLIPNPALTPTSLTNFSTTTNRITINDFAYDEAGNLKNDPVTTANAPNGMKYDGENRQVSYTKASAVTSYAYDGDGWRVKKITGSVTTVFVYNAMGELTAEYTNDTTPPVGGGGTSYLTTDHLGSTRVVTSGADFNGNITVKARYDYLLFGEEIPSTIGGRSGVTSYGGANSTRQKFTQKERDNESGLDYFLARYYSSAQGRFTSADPLLASGTIYDPQTWNRYSYTLNNPLKYVDPSGLYVYGAGATDEEKKKFEKGLEKVRSARDHYRQGSREYNRLDRALTAYGAKGVDNGVTVKFGSAETPGNTNLGIKVDASGNKEKTSDNPTGQNTIVTIDPSRNSSDNEYAFTAAHEGSHVADGSELVGALPRNLTHFFSSATVILNDPNKNLSLFATEFRAYETESFAAQALAPNKSVSVHGYEIWSGGWAEADRAKNRTAGIIKVVAEPRSQGGRYGVTPFGPGRKLIQ